MRHWLFASLLLFSIAGGADPLRVGFFSGTFDPPHEGHSDLIRTSIKELKLDKIIVVTGVLQKHKPSATTHKIREAMSKAAFSEIPQVSFLNQGQQNALREGGIPKLQDRISRDYRDDKIFQIMGDDSFDRLETMKDASFPRNFIIAIRARENDAKIPKSFKGTAIQKLSPDYRQFSSTKFRKMISEGKRPSEISDAVYKIIQAERLYGAKPAASPSPAQAAGAL